MDPLFVMTLLLSSNPENFREPTVVSQSSGLYTVMCTVHVQSRLVPLTIPATKVSTRLNE